MNGKFATLLVAAVFALVSQIALSGSASAACRAGYKPVKYHGTNNIVCVIDAVAGNNKFKAK